MNHVLLFPSYPFQVDTVDPGFVSEEAAARAAGFDTALVDMDDPSIRFHRLPGSGKILYRGWILKPAAYLHLTRELTARGLQMIVGVTEYLESHDFPAWYEKLKGYTPLSFMFQLHNLSHVPRLAAKAFGNKPLIVKDWVKSRKHEWRDACFISSASDASEVERVVGNFVDRQGADLDGTLVLREFVEFEQAGRHPRSKMPLVKEWRVFCWRGAPIYTAPYWGKGASYGAGVTPPTSWLVNMASRISSPFFVLDVARRLDGDYMVIEVNDGGTAGVPEGGSSAALYAALRQAKPHGLP